MSLSLENLKNLDIEKLYHFQMIYKQKSIKQTALKYNIDPHVLRHSLKTIQLKLNTNLYFPSKRNFMPTDKGKELFDLCENIINLIKNFSNEKNEKEVNLVRQDFVIVTSTTLAHFVFPSILLEFAKLYPNLSVHLYAGPEYFNNRDFVFDVIYGPNIQEPKLIKRKMKAFTYHFFANKKICQELNYIHSPYDLKNQDLLMFSGDHLIDNNIIENNNIKFISPSYPLLLDMCIKGLGLLSIFDIGKLNSFYRDVDIKPLFPNYNTEVTEAYFCFNRFNNKIKIIEDLCKLILKNVTEIKI